MPTSWEDGKSASAAAASFLLQRHPLVPVRPVSRQAQRLDLGLDGSLRLRVAMDEEHSLGPRFPAIEAREPRQQLRFIGMG